MDVLKKFINLVLVSTVLLTTMAYAEDDKRSQAIKQVLKTQQNAWNSGDIPGYMKGYWKSPELTFVSGGSITYGWQQTLDRYLKRYDKKDKVGVLNFEDLSVKHLSDTHSLAAGIWRLNRESGEVWGRFSLVFKQIDGDWVIVYDHTSVSS